MRLSFLTEDIDEFEVLKNTIQDYIVKSEILSPDYKRLSLKAKRLFEKEMRKNQKFALELLHKYQTNNEQNSTIEFINQMYYGNTTFSAIKKKERTIEKFKASGQVIPDDVRQLIEQIQSTFDSWKPIINQIDELESKIITTKASREREKQQEQEVMFRDYGILIKLLNSKIEEYKKVAEQMAREFLNSKVPKLEQNNWDLKKVVSNYDHECWPCRSGGGCIEHNPTEHSSQIYGFYSKITSPVNPSRKKNEPDIRRLNQDAVNRYIESSVKDAENEYIAFIAKMTEKIGKPVVDASIDGNIWDRCTLHVTTNDGEKQSWFTQMIWNTSVYGKIFNQFPTRRVS